MKKGKRKKDAAKTRLGFFRFLFIMLVCLFGAGVLFAGAVCVFTEPVDARSLSIKMTSVLYYEDEDGEKRILQNLYDDENRVWVDFDKIPLDMKNAFVAIEDERFFTHPGFDVKRTGAAAMNTVMRIFDKSRTVYGGSTITQQLVKNLTGDDKRSIMRKLQEIYRAVRLERDLSKNEILELYLNTIYLSQNCNGVSTASRVYFGKDVSDLSLAQCASIAGITQYPSLYDPYINPEANKEKQLTVLSKMLELGMITEAEYSDAADEELEFCREGGVSGGVYSYFVDTVIASVSSDLVEKYGYSEAMAQQMIYTGGLQIKCTIDPEIQKIMESVYTDEDNYATKNGEMMQSAMVVIEQSTGEIKGVVGGMGEKQGSLIFNHATALRQPGSTIKPIAVYAPALDEGVIKSTSVLQDVPTTFTLSDGTKWTPRNSGGNFSGAVSLKTAVARSLNIPAVKTLEELGIEESYEFLEEKLGISSLVDRRSTDIGIVSDKALAALSLGGLTDGISTVELAGAYAAIANDGVYIEPHTYTEIRDYNGGLLFTNRPETHRAMKTTTSIVMTDLLRGVVSYGTGTGAAFSGTEIAGKTGTTTNDHDRWFAGYTPAYTAVTWVGYDTPTAINVYGNPAVPLWKSVMSKLDYEDKPTSFRDVLSYDDMKYRSVCSVSGLAATDVCREAGTVYSQLTEKNAPRLGECNSSFHEDDEADEESTEDKKTEDKTEDKKHEEKTEDKKQDEHKVPEKEQTPEISVGNSTTYGADEIR